MGGPSFKLGTIASADRRFAGLVMDDRAIDLATIPHLAKSSGARSGVLSDPGSVLGLLRDWDRNFPLLQAIAAFIAEVEGLGRQRNRVVAGSAAYGAGHDAPR